jgi:hypothetical protein
MKLVCPQNQDHKTFVRESYDSKGHRVNLEIVDEYGRFVGDQLDLYTGDVTYTYVCYHCGAVATEAA